MALKYCFNPVDVSIEYSAVSAVISQYSGAIACGAVDPETQIPAFVQALENAGINTIHSRGGCDERPPRVAM